MRPARCVGVAGGGDAVATFAAAAATAGLEVRRADGAAVAWDPNGVPRVGTADAADGSFVVVDGEVLDAGTGPPPDPDAAAASLLRRLRDAGVGGLADVHLEALVTWWDARARQLRVVRDHTGVVGGLIASRRGTTVWAAEPRDLLLAGVAPVPDPIAVDQMLTVGWVTPPRSFLDGVDTIAAGHQAIVEQGGRHALTRWHAPTARPPIDASVDEQASMLGAALERAVARRAHGTRLGATLSSGVDSTVLVSIVRKVLGLDVDTFTFRYLGYEGQLNEDEHAATTARILGVPHHVVPVSPDDLAERFEWMVEAYQSPFTFGVHSFSQAAIVDAGITTMLGGSDPGFWRDYGTTGALMPSVRRVPHGIRAAVRRAVRAAPRVPGRDQLWFALLLADHGVMNEYTPVQTRRALHGRVADDGTRAMADSLDRGTRANRAEPASRRAVFVFEQLAIPEYVAQWNHRWARAHGFVQRAPFWDTEVVTLLNRRAPWGGDKPPLRRYARTLVPPEQATFPKIHQEVPLGPWFRGPLQDFVRDRLSASRVADAGLFDPTAVDAIVDEHLTQGRHSIWTVWTLLTATEWALQLRRRSGPTLLDRAG